MEQNLLIDDADDGFWLFDGVDEDDVGIEDDVEYPSKSYNGWNYKKDFGEDTLKKLYRDREARQRFILLRLFTMRLPNISDQAKNGLFIAFSRSNSFGVLEHNALLDALAHPVKGLNLFEYDELG
ncbi:8156_t:CDS:1, partial [Funneliformis geosporum]